MKCLTLSFVLAVLCGCGHAGTYLVESAPEPNTKTALSTERIFVVPFKDSRTDKGIYRGRAEWEAVYVDAAGRTNLAKAWTSLSSGNISYLWHRQLVYQLADQGFNMTAAALPVEGDSVLKSALENGSSLVMEGDIKKLFIDKKGADMFLGTSLSGTNYNFKSVTNVRVKDAHTGKVKFSKDLAYEHSFYNKEMLGTDDRDTFPAYFATGLINATKAFSEDADLRKAVGVPTCTVTPTSTITPEIKQPTPGPTPSEPVATPTPEGPYWVNPISGKRMDPSWKFDPEDGLPRSKFVLRNAQK